MKRIFSFFAAAAVVLSLGLSGCANEDPASPLDVDMNRTATLHGTVLVNWDLSKATADQKWTAAEIKADNFIVTLPYSALNSGASGTYTLPKDKITYKSSDGTYEIIVPVGVSATTVTVKITDFPGTVKQADGKTINVIWNASKTNLTKSVSAGEVAYMDAKELNATKSDYKEVTADGSVVK